MEKMVKVKHRNELQKEIELCKEKAVDVENAMQPLISEALELSTATDAQLKVFKEYAAFAQQRATETSAEVLQELVEKEQAANSIIYDLNKQFSTLADKVRLPEELQSVPGRPPGES